MNYGGSMPDWHQYNASQTNEVTAPTQNVNTGHLGFMPGVNPPTLNAIGLNTESLNKHQNDANFNPRNYQSFNNVSSGSNISNSNPLASMVQMQNCIGHYGSPNTRNPMLDNINASVDPRNTALSTINDEIGYRSNQVPFSGPISHLSGPVCNLNASTGPGPVPVSRNNSGQGLGSNPGNGTDPGSIFSPNSRHGPALGSGSGPTNMGPQNTNIGSVPPSGKPSPSFVPCKGLCCNSDPNINYQQWEKYGMYQNNTSYRDNLHSSNYQVDSRHYGNNCNFRKDNLEGKDMMGTILPNASAVDHRRNFADYKYHKDHVVHRNYSASTGMFHNYPMQSYNYSTEHQKYPYAVKEHTKTNSMNMANSGLLKQQEQNFLAQQKYNNKQFQYQSGSMLPKRVPTLNVNTNVTTSSQNPYIHSQFSRNVPAEISHKCPETTENSPMANRMQSTFVHSSPSQHQMYQHKIAMQKFSMENHLRELSRIPGYQSHPKYKECVLRYREILKLQQTVGYQNTVQQPSCAAMPVNTGVPPINLQFDHNGMLINSSYLPDGFPKLHHAPTVEQPVESIDKQTKDPTIEIANEKCQQPQQLEELMIRQQSEHIPSPSAEAFHKQNQFSIHKDLNQNQLKVQTSETHSFDTLSTDTRNEAILQQKASKEFTNKPDLDVRQFLANWDETDDEDGTTTNLSDNIFNETTPVVVVSYENVDLLSKTAQTAEPSRRSSFCSNDALESGKEDQANVIATQDCLTISYSSPDNAELGEPTKRTIGQGVVKPGSIIHCISNGPDEIPTIHIVDNLEISNILGASNDQVIQTLEKQKTVSFFRETSCDDTEEISLENTEQQKKEKTRVLSSNYNTALDDASKTCGMKDTDISETVQVATDLTGTEKSSLDVSDNMGLKKQHSFEESHNPDDISLPDLPTSECTPISTTLNTPIHSDTEETSQNMEDLSISTNPIEVMQNSSVISFTQLNTEEKVKNRPLTALGLEFQKDNCYKNNESNGNHEEDVSLNNFDFPNTSKGKSTEIMPKKEVKSLGSTTVRKISFLTDSKENDTNLTSMGYEMESQHEAVEDEKNLVYKSQNSMREGRRKSIESKTNLTLIESDDESHNVKNERELFKKKRVKTLLALTNTPSEVDLTNRKKIKRIANWEDKCIDRYLAQRRDASNLRQSKNSNIGSSQGGEHSLCHTTSQYKHYSTAVIKDNVNLGDKRLQGTTDSSTMNSNNTKESVEEPATRKQLSSKAVAILQESIHSQTSKLLQKDLKTVDGAVRYTAEEIRLLKEYRKKKEKLDNNEVKSRSHSFKVGVEEELQKDKENSVYQRSKLDCSQIKLNNETLAPHTACLEQDSASSIVHLETENVEVQEETKVHSSPKSLITNADFGIQVANVNLKIKEKDIGKDLILGDKGLEHNEGIKIEIKVSCAERTSKEQEQNRRIGYNDRTLCEVDNSLPYSKTLENQRKLYYKDQDDNSKLSAKLNTVVDGKNSTETNLGTMCKKGGQASLELNEESSPNVSKETSSSFNKTLRSCPRSKDVEQMEAIETNDFSIDHVDIIKSKSAISNTAMADANNKVKNNGKQGSLSMNEEVVGTSQSKISKKLPESNLVELSTKSLNSLKILDFNFEKLGYKRDTAVHLDRCNRLEDELEKDGYVGKWKKPKIDIFEDCDMFQSSSGYANPIFSSIDKLEDLHTVPVYTTKDGKISYSPNRKFTYHELMMEARKREVCSFGRKSHCAETWNNYYNSKFRKLYKKKRYHGLSEKKKNEYKATKYLYDRKRNYSDEFFSKSHVRYKDYVPSIRNNNAIWSDHCNKMDKMYSSSDSDEELFNRSKIGCADVSGYTESFAIENQSATICQFDRNEIVLLELDHEGKKEEHCLHDVELHKDKDGNAKGEKTVEHEILDIAKDNQDTNNCNDSTVCDKQSDTVQSSGKEENVPCTRGESSALGNSKLISEDLKKNEAENNECVNMDADEVINVRTEVKSLDLKLLNEDPPLHKENYEQKKNEDKGLSEVVEEQNGGSDTNVSQDNKTFLKVDNDTENTDELETNTNFEINQIKDPETEIDNNIIQDVFSETLNLEISDEVSTEIVKCPEQKINLIEENNSKCDKESNLICKTIELLMEQKNRGEEEKEKSMEILEQKTYISSINETSAGMNSIEPESQIMQSNQSINEPNYSEKILIESTRHEENIRTNSEEVDDNVDTEEENFTGFSKNEIPNIGDKNIAEVEETLSAPNIEEAIIESELLADIVKNENAAVDLQSISEQKINFRRDSSVEEDMSVLSEYGAIKGSPTADPTVIRDKNAGEEREQEKTQCNCSERIPSNTTINSLNIYTKVKTIPKLVIKKTDALNCKSESSLDYADVSENRYDGKLSELRPKIPKMIIMKNRSRSATPTTEVLEKNKSLPMQNAGNIDVDNSDSESYTLKYNNYEDKVPKVKIKLEDISSKDLKLYLKRKAIKNNVPKIKIKKLKTQENRKFEMQDTSGSATSDSEGEKNFHESIASDNEIERIPKLKLKRQEESKSSSLDTNKGKDSNNTKVFSKKNKRTKEEETKHTVKYDNNTVISEELKKKIPQCITEKIPKVIIKRTQIGTEFKCEISKRKKSSVAETSKWQPKVKLQRLHVLDYMVKGLKQSTTITLKNVFGSPTHIKDDSNYLENEDSVRDGKAKLCRSNSTSSLTPIKFKQRRLSDSNYMKVNQPRSITEFDNNLATGKLINSENTNYMKMGESTMRCQNKVLDRDHKEENENRIAKHSFEHILLNENNDQVVVRKEHLPFGTMGDTSVVEDKFLDSVMSSCNYDDNDNSIIKVDSSDESQTTIEILPASPDSSEDDIKNCEFENNSRINKGDAIPTQLALELELIDNNNMQTNALLSKNSNFASNSKNTCNNERSREAFFNEFQCSSQSEFGENEYTSAESEQSGSLEKKSKDYFYCNDLLVKEVLAAKETLKKCLTKSENEDTDQKQLSPRTVAEKEQGFSFAFKKLAKSPGKSKDSHFNSDSDKLKMYMNCNSLKKKNNAEERCSKQDNFHSMECPTASTCADSSVPEQTTISLKATKKYGQAFTSTGANNINMPNNNHNSAAELHEKKSTEKIDRKSIDKISGTKTKEDNMPLLVPEFALNIDSSSDRDSSRSPPVITNQEEIEQMVVDAKIVESKVISQTEEVEENKKHSYKDCEMTIADIITQLAYHEKATIKHKRYCNLCERWFPTSSRHRRHLAGYQHRYMELTQRKSIHALFVLFTGKPCPRLLPANVIRTDCSIGELTPLQIAVQDIAKCVEYTQHNLKTKE